MVNITTFIEVALSFPSTEQKPHFRQNSLKVIGRRTFATLHEASNTETSFYHLLINRFFACLTEKLFTQYQTNSAYKVGRLLIQIKYTSSI